VTLRQPARQRSGAESGLLEVGALDRIVACQQCLWHVVSREKDVKDVFLSSKKKTKEGQKMEEYVGCAMSKDYAPQKCCEK